MKTGKQFLSILMELSFHNSQRTKSHYKNKHVKEKLLGGDKFGLNIHQVSQLSATNTGLQKSKLFQFTLQHSNLYKPAPPSFSLNSAIHCKKG